MVGPGSPPAVSGQCHFCEDYLTTKNFEALVNFEFPLQR